MYKSLLGLVLAVFVLAGVAFASDITVQSNGAYVKQASGVNFKGPAVTDNGTGVDVDFLAVTGNMDVSGTLAVGTTNAFTVGATGIIIDTSLYATTAGSGGNRTVCVSADGKIFSSATACP